MRMYVHARIEYVCLSAYDTKTSISLSCMYVYVHRYTYAMWSDLLASLEATLTLLCDAVALPAAAVALVAGGGNGSAAADDEDVADEVLTIPEGAGAVAEVCAGGATGGSMPGSGPACACVDGTARDLLNAWGYSIDADGAPGVRARVHGRQSAVYSVTLYGFLVAVRV